MKEALNGQCPYKPKTPLGRKLVAIRAQAIAQGLRLLTEDEIRDEISHRRGDSV